MTAELYVFDPSLLEQAPVAPPTVSWPAPIPFQRAGHTGAPGQSAHIAEIDGVRTLAGPMLDVDAVRTSAGNRVRYRRGAMDGFSVDPEGALALIRETAVAVADIGDRRRARIAALVVALLDQFDPPEEVTPQLPVS